MTIADTTDNSNVHLFIISYLSITRLVSGSSPVLVTTSSGATSLHAGSFGGGGLQSGQGQDAFGDVEFLSQEVDTFVGQGVVVVLPRELGLDEALRGQRLQRLDDIQVAGVDFFVLGLVEVLLGNNDTFLEQVLVDLLSVVLGNQHGGSGSWVSTVVKKI